MIISTNILVNYNDSEFNYIVTPSATSVAMQLFDALEKRYRCFSLIGNYGTGKSSFLYALELSLNGRAIYFKTEGLVNPEIVKGIGQYQGLIAFFGELLSCHPNLNDIRSALRSIDDKGNRVFIFIDEFGKLVDYALDNDPKREIYNFQVLAEFINNELNNTVLVSTLHQSFESYSFGKGKIELMEWEKVSGRFYPISFNDPPHVVAQIVLQFIKSRGAANNVSTKVGKIVSKCGLVSSDFVDESLDKGSFGPIDALTLFCAIGIFRKYAQNDRSIFTFLNEEGALGLWNEKRKFFGLAELYDYLIYRLGHVLYSPTNPDKLQWESAERAIQRSDSHEDIKPEVAHKILKALHLTNLFAKDSGTWSSESIADYFALLGTKDAADVLRLLIDRNIVQFLNYKGRFVFVEGTDVNLDAELRKANSHISLDVDYSMLLSSTLKLDPFVARRHLFETGTPRVWVFRWVNGQFIDNEPVLRSNGLVVINADSVETIQVKVDGLQYPLVEVGVNLTDNLKISLDLYQRLSFVAEKFRDDRVVKGMVQDELTSVVQDIRKNFLNDLVLTASWKHAGELLEVRSERAMHRVLSNIFDRFYALHPIVHNELVNRMKLSTPVNTARKKLFEDLLNSRNGKLDFCEQGFPPERMIYESIVGQNFCFKESGVDIKDGSTLKDLWSSLEAMLEVTRLQRRPVLDFETLMKEPPFGLKDGLSKVFLGLFLIFNRDTFALLHTPTGKFIPYLHSESIEAVLSKPGEFSVKKYNFDRIPDQAISAFIELTKLGGAISEGNSVRGAFYGIYTQLLRSVNELPMYTKSTRLGIELESRKFLESIVDATDPEQSLLFALPRAFNLPPLTDQSTEQIAQFFSTIDRCITDLVNAKERLIRSLSAVFCNGLGVEDLEFDTQRLRMQGLVSSIDVATASQFVRVIITRINSKLDDEILYWKAILDAIWKSNLDQINDSQIELLRTALRDAAELLVSLSGMVVGSNHNIAVTVTTSSGVFQRRYTSDLSDEVVNKRHGDLLALFEKLSKQDRLALLGKLLQKELE
jgi:hypothetical protein